MGRTMIAYECYVSQDQKQTLLQMLIHFTHCEPSSLVKECMERTGIAHLFELEKLCRELKEERKLYDYYIYEDQTRIKVAFY